MSSRIRIVTTLKGFEEIKKFVSEALKEIPNYNNGSYMDTIHEKIESKEEDYVIFGWDWVEFKEYDTDVKAILNALTYLKENNIAYRYRRMKEGYYDDIEQIDFDNDNALPEIYTSVKFAYDIEDKNKYLVVVKNSFIRDVQVAPDNYISDFHMNVDGDDYDWGDAGEGEFIIGIYEGNDEEKVLVEAATTYHIDKRALKAYEIK